MNKTKELLLERNIITETDTYAVFTMGKQNQLLEGGIYTQQVVIAKEEGLSFTRFFGRGLVKRVYHFGKEINIPFKELTKINFERRKGYVWLDLYVGEQVASLSLSRRDWKKEETAGLVNLIKANIVIGNYDIYKKLNIL